MQSVVIVGAGQAGFQLAASLRQGGFEGPVTLIGDERCLPYQRPPLSKDYLRGATSEDDLYFRPQAFFQSERIDHVVARITDIDRQNRTIAAEDGRIWGYDHLVLATGTRNREIAIPGASRGDLHLLRTIDDARAIAAHLGAPGEAVIVGAGFVGMELASTLSQSGWRVAVVDVAMRVMQRVLSAPMSARMADLHLAHGVQLHLETTVTALTKAGGRVTGVELADGNCLSANLVIVGAGAIPNVELAASAGLATDNGILVDDVFATSDAAISAIGDCARFATAAGRLRLESVQNATDQAKALALRLLGKPKPYDAVPWFWTDQFDHKLQIAGLSQDADDHVVIDDAASMTVLSFKGDRMVAVECLDRPVDYMMARRILATSCRPTRDDAAAPDFSLKAWFSATLS